MSLPASRGDNSHRCAGCVGLCRPGPITRPWDPWDPGTVRAPQGAACTLWRPCTQTQGWPHLSCPETAKEAASRRPHQQEAAPGPAKPLSRPGTQGVQEPGRFGVCLLTTHPLPSSPPTPPQPTPRSLDASLTRCQCPGRGPPPDSPSLSHRDAAPGRGVVMKGVQAGLHPGDTPGTPPGWGVWPLAAPAPPARSGAERGHLSSLRRFIWGGERGVGALSWWRGRLIYRQACFEAPPSRLRFCRACWMVAPLI